MAVTSGAASCLNDALELTPNQIIGLASAVARLRGGGQRGSRGRYRRGTPEEFVAAMMGAR